MKTGYFANIEDLTLENEDFRRVLYTGEHMQLVLMTLQPNEEIGLETHPDNDQFFRFESGEGKVIVNDTEYDVADGDVVIIPAGAEHNVINTSDSENLRMYTIYSPAHHEDGTIHETKEIAMDSDEEFDGGVTEEE
ncbi:MAG: cupin domain-containing protein [Patescibacteria group bacterium]